MARIVAPAADPVAGWERFAGDGFVLPQRAGPEDAELTRALGGFSLWCEHGGAVRWTGGEGHGWRAAVTAGGTPRGEARDDTRRARLVRTLTYRP